MELVISRRMMFLGVIPRKTISNNIDDTLQVGQEFNKVIKTDNFQMRVIVRSEKNCVLTSEQIRWYDPISKEEMSKIKNEIFLVDEENI